MLGTVIVQYDGWVLAHMENRLHFIQVLTLCSWHGGHSTSSRSPWFDMFVKQRKVIHFVDTFASYPQTFSSGTSGGRNWLTG